MNETFALRLSGKAELPKDIAIGHNYNVALEGSITSCSIHDNNDGSYTKIYTFKPVKMDILTDKGEAIKLKDTRSQSQLLRGRFYSVWLRSETGVSFEEWYEKMMANLIKHADELAGMYSK